MKVTSYAVVFLVKIFALCSGYAASAPLAVDPVVCMNRGLQPYGGGCVSQPVFDFMSCTEMRGIDRKILEKSIEKGGGGVGVSVYEIVKVEAAASGVVETIKIDGSTPNANECSIINTCAALSGAKATPCMANNATPAGSSDEVTPEAAGGPAGSASAGSSAGTTRGLAGCSTDVRGHGTSSAICDRLPSDKYITVTASGYIEWNGREGTRCQRDEELKESDISFAVAMVIDDSVFVKPTEERRAGLWRHVYEFSVRLPPTPGKMGPRTVKVKFVSTGNICNLDQKTGRVDPNFRVTMRPD